MFKLSHQKLTGNYKPLEVYQKLVNIDEGYHGFFESAQTEQTLIISKPALVVNIKDYKVQLKALSQLGKLLIQSVTKQESDCVEYTHQPTNINGHSNESDRLRSACVLDIVRKLIEKLPEHKDIPQSANALLGVLGFEAIQYFESLTLCDKDPLDFPDALFLFPQSFAFCDKGRLSLYSLNLKHNDANTQLKEMMHRISHKLPHDKEALPSKNIIKTPQEHFKKLVSKLKAKINQGSLFQCVIARRFTIAIKHPFIAFKKLTASNPSPYHFYLHTPDHTLFGASPETAVQVNKINQDYQVIIRPLAGTKRSSQTDKSLKSDPKELAEHMMLVDLARNDLARICKPGSRKVTELANEHHFNHICHIRSQIEGLLQPELDCLHTLRACLPMGTLSGAPKIKAVQTIMDLELQRRGHYGGTFGTFRKDGTMDTAIVIRSCCVHKGMAHVTSGAGIVKRSNPQAETLETELKAESLLNILGGQDATCHRH